MPSTALEFSSFTSAAASPQLTASFDDNPSAPPQLTGLFRPSARSWETSNLVEESTSSFEALSLENTSAGKQADPGISFPKTELSKIDCN